jgi:NAD-dependent SIR2 family protein deacetylase
MSTKLCTRCDEAKPFDAFRLRRSDKAWRLPWCHDCKREYDRKSVATKRAGHG